MRKIFIALFLIFFAHCECVLAITTQCNALPWNVCATNDDCMRINDGDEQRCIYRQCNQRDTEKDCMMSDDCFWDTRNGKCMRNKCNELGKNDCVAEAGCYYMSGTCYITLPGECSDSGGVFSFCSSGTSNPGSSCSDCTSNEAELTCAATAGKYWNYIKDECTDCEAGYYCPEYDSSREQCPAGTYSNTTGSTECKGCPAGQWSQAESTTCTNCPAGTYRTSGGNGCVACGAGTYSTAGSSKCTQCDAGTYSTLGSSTCTSCPTGSTTSGTGATSCNICEPGYYYDSEKKEIIECSFDHYCPGGEGCLAKECPAGTSTIDNEGAYPWDSADDCLFNADRCKAASGYYVNNEKCDICPAGYYCPVGHLDRVQCPTETPVSDPGSDDISDCEAITGCADVAYVAGCGGSDDNAARIKTCRNMAGCYWNETEKICADCPVGSYCTNCSEKKIGCPTGTKTSGLGAKQKSDCYLKYNKLKQNDTEIKIPSMSDPHATQSQYTGLLYFYSTVPENCPPSSAVCPAPDGTGGVAGGIVSQK